MRQFDLIIVGGGIVGLATAREFLNRRPGIRLAVLEKEPALGYHQTGHNSGVLHAGIYYKPGSLKAKGSVEGRAAMVSYCDEKGIPYELCGKVIVALDESEIPKLDELFERGIANGVPGIEMIGPERLREIEPHAAGIRAIYSPNTGIVDYSAVARSYAEDVQAWGGEVFTECKVLSLESRAGRTVIETTQGAFEAGGVVTCAGLYSDKIAGESDNVRIVPFRGSYYNLRPEARKLVRGLIYPVPDPRFPFLGVHFTKVMNGEVWVGPNAVLAFAREGYERWKINPDELREVLTFPGFWKLATTYWKMGLLEMYRDYVKMAYVRTAQAYLPALSYADLLAGTAGVRAQALRADGSLVKDFLIKHGDNVTHIQNAPSPAATSSLVIARMIADEAETNFQLA